MFVCGKLVMSCESGERCYTSSGSGWATKVLLYDSLRTGLDV
jgi:hypothetical protein